MESSNLYEGDFPISKVTFCLTYNIKSGGFICITGSGDKLKDWTSQGLIYMENIGGDKWQKNFGIQEIESKAEFKFVVKIEGSELIWSKFKNKKYDLDGIKEHLEKNKEKFGTGDVIEIKKMGILKAKYSRMAQKITIIEDFENPEDDIFDEPTQFQQNNSNEESKQIEEEKKQDSQKASDNCLNILAQSSNESKSKDEVKEEVGQAESKLKHQTHCEYKEDDQILTLEVNVNAQENLQENVISSIMTQLPNNYKDCKYFNIELKDSCKISQFNLEEVKISELQTDIKELTINFNTNENIEIENFNSIILTILKCAKELKIRELIFNGISRSILTKLLEDQEDNCFSHVTFLRIENLKDDTSDDLKIKTDITSLKCVSLYNVSDGINFKTAFSKVIRNIQFLEKE